MHHTAISDPGIVNAGIGMQVNSSLYSMWYLQQIHSNLSFFYGVTMIQKRAVYQLDLTVNVVY